MKSKRKLVFWAVKRRPSSIMRGIQIAEALSKRGHETEVRLGLSMGVLRDLHDSVIVCVKSAPCFPGWLKRRGNKIVYDAIDFNRLRGIPAEADAVIAGSEEMRGRLEKFVGSKKPVRVIYHHADPLLKTHRAGDVELKLAYIGETESSKFIDGVIPELNLVSFKTGEDWRERIRDFNAHFSARMDPNKSVIKLSNVAALGAVFLTGSEPGCVELLGKDYPFFLRNPENLRIVREDVRNLNDSVGGGLWKEARERIDRIRELLTLDRSAQAYEELIQEIS